MGLASVAEVDMVAEPRDPVLHKENLARPHVWRFHVSCFQPSTELALYGIHGRGPWLGQKTCLALSKAVALSSTVPTRAASHTLTPVVRDAQVLSDPLDDFFL